jgi:hypothetical protein
MDAVLRARHDALSTEFICAATLFNVTRTPAGSLYSRTIDPFCGDERATLFGTLLTEYGACCSQCAFLNPRPAFELQVDDATSNGEAGILEPSANPKCSTPMFERIRSCLARFLENNQ